MTNIDNITTEKLERLGLRHWQKNGYDRIYINLDLNAMTFDGLTLDKHMNRYERQNHKVYWDCKTDELHIDNVRHDSAIEAIKVLVAEMVA